MSYVIELRTPSAATSYVLTQAASREDARAMVDAELAHDELDEFVIVAVHSVH